MLWGNTPAEVVIPYLIQTCQNTSNNSIYVHGHIYVWARVYMDVYLLLIGPLSRGA